MAYKVAYVRQQLGFNSKEESVFSTKEEAQDYLKRMEKYLNDIQWTNIEEIFDDEV